MTSAYAIERNRRNATRSTGPTSPAGKSRSRFTFDPDHDGELMRPYEASCDRSFHRVRAQLRLLRQDALTAAAKLRNEPVAAYVARDDLAGETGKPAEPGTRRIQILRNEPVAASVDRDDLAGETGNPAEPGTRHGQILRNEPVAASINRDDSAGRALPPMPPDRQRPRNPRSELAFGSKPHLADSIAVPARAVTTTSGQRRR